jgi:hypothetical protein
LNKYYKSYFNLLIEYNSTIARKELPTEFETLEVKINETKYPGLRVSYPWSSIFFAPNIYCDPNSYFYDDDLASKTVDAHNFINSHILNKVIHFTKLTKRTARFNTLNLNFRVLLIWDAKKTSNTGKALGLMF